MRCAITAASSGSASASQLSHAWANSSVGLLDAAVERRQLADDAVAARALREAGDLTGVGARLRRVAGGEHPVDGPQQPLLALGAAGAEAGGGDHRHRGRLHALAGGLALRQVRPDAARGPRRGPPPRRRDAAATRPRPRPARRPARAGARAGPARSGRRPLRRRADARTPEPGWAGRRPSAAGPRRSPPRARRTAPRPRRARRRSRAASAARARRPPPAGARRPPSRPRRAAGRSPRTSAAPAGCRAGARPPAGARRAARACRAGCRRRAPRAAGSPAPTERTPCASASARSSSVVSGWQPQPAALRARGRLDEALGEAGRVLARRGHDEHAVGDEPPHHEQQRAQRRHVGPVRVVEEQHDRVLVLQRAEQLEDPRARRRDDRARAAAARRRGAGAGRRRRTAGRSPTGRRWRAGR